MIVKNGRGGGIVPTTVEIIKENGILSLWRGTTPTILRALPSSSLKKKKIIIIFFFWCVNFKKKTVIFFGTMSLLRKYFATKMKRSNGIDFRERGFPNTQKFLISGGARVIATIFDNPLTVGNHNN